MPGIEHAPDGVTVVQGDEAISTEAVVANAEAHVEIARIDAEASVERAEIQAETEVAAIEAAAEVATAVTREELDECRRNIETLQTGQTTLLSQTQLILDQLAELTEEETEEEASPPNPQEPPESERDVHPEARTPEAESPPEPEKKKPRVNWT